MINYLKIYIVSQNHLEEYMSKIHFSCRKEVPVEMHKVKIVQKLNLLPAKGSLVRFSIDPSDWYLLHHLVPVLRKGNRLLYGAGRLCRRNGSSDPEKLDAGYIQVHHSGEQLF